MDFLTHIFKKHTRVSIVSILLIVFVSIYFARVAPAAGPFTPGGTLDPDCTPGSVNCTVEVIAPQTLPNAGKFLTTNGTTTSWATVTGMGIGNAVASGTSGSILFVNSSGNLAQNNTKLFWDNTSNRLGIGTSTPDYPLTVYGGSAFGEYLRVGEGILNWGESSDPVHLILNKDDTALELASSGGVSIGDLTGTNSGAKLVVSGSEGFINLLNSNVGIGTVSPTNTIHIEGSVKIVDGSQGAGKILTSDADGVASWQSAGGGGSGWSLTGNAGLVDGTNFIGTTDNIPFNIKVNNQKAGRVDSTGSVFLGYEAGKNSDTATVFNTAIGYQALRSNTTGNYSTANGFKALTANTTGNENTANGYQALYSNTTGSFNTANGTNALMSNTTGLNNTAVGLNALISNINGNNNTANGYQALFSNTTGSNNIANGVRALYSNTIGSGNIAIGSEALKVNISGDNNTAIGINAIFWNTTGFDNVANGYEALYFNTTGIQNTALGNLAGETTTSANANTTGSQNTFIGYNSGPGTPTQLTNATAIGANARVNMSNALVLGDSSVNVGIGTTSPATKLHISGGSIYTSNAGKGLIVKSPDGLVCKEIGIDNAGAIILNAIICP